MATSPAVMPLSDPREPNPQVSLVFVLCGCCLHTVNGLRDPLWDAVFAADVKQVDKLLNEYMDDLGVGIGRTATPHCHSPASRRVHEQTRRLFL